MQGQHSPLLESRPPVFQDSQTSVEASHQRLPANSEPFVSDADAQHWYAPVRAAVQSGRASPPVRLRSTSPQTRAGPSPQLSSTFLEALRGQGTAPAPRRAHSAARSTTSSNVATPSTYAGLGQAPEMASAWQPLSTDRSHFAEPLLAHPHLQVNAQSQGSRSTPTGANTRVASADRSRLPTSSLLQTASPPTSIAATGLLDWTRQTAMGVNSSQQPLTHGDPVNMVEKGGSALRSVRSGTAAAAGGNTRASGFSRAQALLAAIEKSIREHPPCKEWNLDDRDLFTG